MGVRTTTRAVKGSHLTWAEMDANWNALDKECGTIGANIASATTTDLNTATGNKVQITGTTTITGFGSGAPTGTIRILHFPSSLTITYGAGTIIMPNASNLVTQTGDIVTFIHEGSGVWRLIDFVPGDNRVFAKFVIFPPIYDNGSWASSTQTLTFTNGARQRVTMAAAVTTLNLVAPLGIGSYQCDFYQDSTGTRVMTWPATFKWPANYATADKALTTTANARDRLIVDYDGTNYVAGLIKGIA